MRSLLAQAPVFHDDVIVEDDDDEDGEEGRVLVKERELLREKGKGKGEVGEETGLLGEIKEGRRKGLWGGKSKKGWLRRGW